MADESKLMQEQARARGADALLKNDLLAEAFKGLEDGYLAQWRATTLDQVNAREKLFLAVNVVGMVRDHLVSIVKDGKLAAAEIKALQEMSERRRSFMS